MSDEDRAEHPEAEVLEEECQRRVLVAYTDSVATRSIRLTLEGMRDIQVDSSPTAEHCFELALQYEYDLFFFGLEFPNLSGELLYNLIDTAYRFGDSNRVTAPGVIFLADGKIKLPPSLKSDIRVKGGMAWPFKMDALLETVDRELPGTGKGKALL